MSDKLRRTFPIRVTVGDGEQPTGGKLNSVSEQARNGLNVVEKAVGDPWGQSGDDTLVNYPLRLPNLARMVGQNHLLNPTVFPTSQDFQYVDDLNLRYPTLTHGYLRFSPKSGVTINSTTGSFVTEVAREDLVTTSGEYWVESGTTGKFRCFYPISGTEDLRYTVGTTDEWIKFQDVLPGVIPDPRQTTWSGVRFSESSGSFYIHLPPREPITFSDSREAPVWWPASSEWSNNYATSTAAPYRLWQDPTVSGLDDDHYRYSLPKELIDQWSLIANGARLPTGFMYLWDQTNKRIVEDAVFYKTTDEPTKKYRLRVEASSITLSGLTSSDETSTSYNSAYSIITPGANLAASQWEQDIRFLTHEHNNKGDFSSPLSHDNLLDTNPPTSDYSDHSARYPTYLPAWFGSAWAGDAHTSLLSRAGSQTDGARVRDPNNNAMLGHLVLASNTVNDVVSGVFLDSSLINPSFKLYFGDIGGPSIFSNTFSGLVIDAGSLDSYGLSVVGGTGSDENLGINVWGGASATGIGGAGINTRGGTGVNDASDGVGIITRSKNTALYALNLSTAANNRAAVLAVSLAGRSLELIAKITNPTQAAMLMTPQDDMPVSGESGDLYIDSKNDRLYQYETSGQSFWPLRAQLSTLTAVGFSEGFSPVTTSYQRLGSGIYIPANTLQVGSTIRIHVAGTIDLNSPASNFFYPELRINGVVISTTPSLTIANATLKFTFSVNYMMTVIDITAASGDFIGDLTAMVHDGSSDKDYWVAPISELSLDTTEDLGIELWAKINSSDAGSSTALMNFTVDVQ